MAEQMVTLKEAVQIRLGARVATDPGLRAQLESDPASVIKPIIAELLGDDGELDLSEVTTTVHFESGNDLHFVIAPEAVELDAEVGGFASDPLTISGYIGSYDVGFGDISGDGFIKKRTEGGRCTNSGHRGTKCCYL